MKYLFIRCVCCFFVQVFVVAKLFSAAVPQKCAVDMRRPIVLILTSDGGGGHRSATDALCSYLGRDYDIRLKYILKDSLPFQQWGGAHGEAMYNKIAAGPLGSFLISSIFRLGHAYFTQFQESIASLVREHLIQERPDLVISVVPLINAVVYRVTAELNIPFLLVPTDIDMATFIEGVGGCEHPCFVLNELFPMATAQGGKDKHAVSYGFPLRLGFYEAKKKDRKQLIYDYAARFGFNPENPIILLMMGAQGSSSILDYMRYLSEVDAAFNLIICRGGSAVLDQAIHRQANLFKNKETRYVILPRVDYIADLMFISSLFITKSGTASVCEAIQMRLPMLLDATHSVIPWEQRNHEFVEEHNLGISIKDPVHLASIVKTLLTCGFCERMRGNFDFYAHDGAPAAFKGLVDTMVVCGMRFRSSLHGKIL